MRSLKQPNRRLYHLLPRFRVGLVSAYLVNDIEAYFLKRRAHAPALKVTQYDALG